VISQLTGTLVAKELDRIEVQTGGGVTYELSVPLTAYETLPRIGEAVTVHTAVIVREDEWQLYGFVSASDRRVFRRLLAATGVGPALALGMLSTLSAERLVRAIREKDVATLMSVPRVGRKKAEQLILDLAEKLEGVLASTDGAARPSGGTADDAIRALVSLGYANPDAEKAVRKALDSLGPNPGAPEVIRVALAKVRG
jgi:Holliday junction DNA helicase RuvA